MADARRPPADAGLTVAVDGRALAGAGPGRGIAHYLRALLRAWPAGDELRLVVARGVGDRVAAALAGGAARIVVIELALGGRLPYGLAALTGRPRLDAVAGGCDVAWVPAPAPVAVGGPLVLTVHDRSWECRPQDFTGYERAWHAAARPRRLGRRAARVLATTGWGRDDLVAAWGLDPARVAAVPLAPAVAPGLEAPSPTVGGAVSGHASPRPAATTPSPAGRATARPGATTPGPVGRPPAADAGAPVLFVGALEPRKGPDVLAEAIRLARPRGFAAPVVVAGSGRLDGLLRAPGVWSAPPWTGRADGALGDADLAALYATARALVVPSRLEGFGLPGLEALAHGTPVVASDLPPVREVLGDAATYVPAADARALADALLDLPARPAAPGPLAGRGWAAVARETRAVLADAAADGPPPGPPRRPHGGRPRRAPGAAGRR